MPVTTLYEYYTQKGLPFPSWRERAPLYESLGLGPATKYIGSGPQNVRLLKALLAKKPIVPIKEPVIPKPPIEAPEIIAMKEKITETEAKIKELTGIMERAKPLIEAGVLKPTEEIPEYVITAKSPQEALKIKIAEIKEKIKETTEKLAKAKAAGYETGEIPDWVFEAASPKEAAALVKPKRIEELEKLAFAPPPKTYEEIYKEAYETAGLANVKKKIEDLDAKILKVKSDLYEAEADINENPWFSETGRVGRIKKLYDVAQKDIDLLVEQRKSLAEEHNIGIKAAGETAERTLKGWETQGKLYQAELTYLTKTGKGEEYLSVSEAKTLKLPYGTTKAEAMAKGIVPADTAKEWTEFTDVEKRKLTAAGIDWTTLEGYMKAVDHLYPEVAEKEERKRLNIAIAGMTSELNKVIGDDGFISPESWKMAKKAWVDAGLDPEKFIKQFYIYINPDEPRGVKEYGVREEKYIKGELPAVWAIPPG